LRSAIQTTSTSLSIKKDPSDRIIVATARILRAPVVTIDQLILAYGRRGQVDVIDY
jgi:PIN domain nuclease of toxin-antitoxin system